MAVVTFAGTTLWSDSLTGVGALSIQWAAPAREYLYRTIPGGTGRIAVDNGVNAGGLQVMARYHLTDNQMDDLETDFAAVSGFYGTAVAGAVSLGDCVMEQPQIQKTPGKVRVGNDEFNEVYVRFSFVRMKG